MTNFLGIDVGSDYNITKIKNITKLYKINFLQLYFQKNLNELCLYNFFKKYNIIPYIHSSYSNNFASNWNNTSSWIYDAINEIYYAKKIGAYGIIFHIGKQLNLSHKNAMDNIISSIVYIYNKTSLLNIKLILETSAGQGSELCYNLLDLSVLYKKINKMINSFDKIKICLDTCHIFAAGYDITSKKKIVQFLKLFDKLIGLDNICVVHLNDSKNICGSRIDRHENIGKGHIGKKNLKIIFKFFKNRKIPCILETDPQFYKNDFNILKNTK